MTFTIFDSLSADLQKSKKNKTKKQKKREAATGGVL